VFWIVLMDVGAQHYFFVRSSRQWNGRLRRTLGHIQDLRRDRGATNIRQNQEFIGKTVIKAVTSLRVRFHHLAMMCVLAGVSANGFEERYGV